MKNIYIVGSLNMDLVIKAPVMPRSGETLGGSDFMSNPGGKGANQAVAVAKLGGNAHMVGCVGQAFGDELVWTLKKYGVGTQYVEQCGDVSSGIAVIVVVDGDNRIILDRGANGRVSRALIDRALAQAKEGDFLVVQLEIAQNMVEYALSQAKRKKMVTVLNPAPAVPLSKEIFSVCDYFTPNQSEAQFYTGIYPEEEESARRCAEVLAQKGVKNLVITMGAEGSAAVCGGEFRKVSAYRAGDVVDTTAAGDTYVGAFVTALSEGKGVDEAMAFACRAAGLTVTRRGAQQSIPTREETDALA